MAEKLHNCLELADGTILNNGRCGYTAKNLWCWISGKTFAEAFVLFSDVEKIKKITCYYYEKRVIYEGFTDILLIQKSETGFGEDQIDVRLTWPEGGEHSIREEDIPDDEEESEENQNGEEN